MQILVSSQTISSRLDDSEKLNLLVIDSKGLEIFNAPLNNVSSWWQTRINWESLDLCFLKLRSTVDFSSNISTLRSVDLGSSKLQWTVDLGS